MPSKIVRTYKHPGLPRIDVVQKLRTSVQREMRKIDKSAFAVYDVADYQTEHGPHTFIGREASKEGLMGFAAYFDKAAYTQLIDDISKQMYEKGSQELKEALQRGTKMAKDEIKRRPRKFKSKNASSVRADGDIYDALADSLDFSMLEEGNRQRQRFQRYTAGSYDRRGVGGAIVPERLGGQPAKNQPTGYFGSRMKEHPSDKSLTEIYRRGRRASTVSRTTPISEHAKRLKGRSD